MVLAPTDELRQRMERRKDGPIIYTYAAIGGENRLLSNLGDLPSFKAVPRYLPGTADLEAFLRGLGGREERVVAVRTREANVHPGALDGVETSDHLARLWAFDRIDALMHPRVAARRRPRPIGRRRWRSRRRYHLVTGVSGAVVLDSQAETDAVAGSDPRQQRPDGPRTRDLGVARAGRGAAAGACDARRRLVARGRHEGRSLRPGGDRRGPGAARRTAIACWPVWPW